MLCDHLLLVLDTSVLVPTFSVISLVIKFWSSTKFLEILNDVPVPRYQRSVPVKTGGPVQTVTDLYKN